VPDRAIRSNSSARPRRSCGISASIPCASLCDTVSRQCGTPRVFPDLCTDKGVCLDKVGKGYVKLVDIHRVIAPGEAPPARSEALHQSFFTKRKKDVVAFNYADSGKTACFAVQIEKDGKKGRMGTLKMNSEE
jgi:hypothetical protein